MHITPKVAAALRAFEASETGELTRCSGGYRPAGFPQCEHVRVTMRTVKAMNRDWLVELDGPFASAVRLTTKGRQALDAMQQQAVNAAEAG